MAQIPGDGRWVITPDRASHFLVTAGVHWQDYKKDDRTRTRITFQGMTDKAATDLVPLAESWLYAPEMIVKTEGYIDGTPGARSEMAVPLILGDSIIGILDAESDVPCF